MLVTNAGATDVSDRAARLLGVVYGSQGQQLLQRAVSFDLQAQLRSAGVEIDPRDMSDRITRDVGWVGDRWFRELRAGRAFCGTAGVVAGAGNLPHVQLFNPAGSGVVVVPYAVLITSDTAQAIRVMIHNTALITAQTDLANLLIGGAAPVAQVRALDGAATGTTSLVVYRTLADVHLWWSLPGLWEAGAGEGVLVRGETAASTIRLTFWWLEL